MTDQSAPSNNAGIILRDSMSVAGYNPADDFADMRPSDHITPRLALMQPTSEQVNSGMYRSGDIIITGENQRIFEYGPNAVPVQMIPVMFWFNWVEWNPDRAVPKSKRIINQSIDPASDLARRAANRELVEGPKGPQLAITEYYNVIVAIPSISGAYDIGYVQPFARASHAAGKMWLNRCRRVRMPDGSQAPIWRNSYAVGSERRTNERNETFWVPSIGMAKPVPDEAFPALIAYATALRGMKSAIAERVVEQEAAGEGASEGAGAAQANTTNTGTTGKGDEPPF